MTEFDLSSVFGAVAEAIQDQTCPVWRDYREIDEDQHLPREITATTVAAS